jgi:cytochrome c oxidase subunit 3
MSTTFPLPRVAAAPDDGAAAKLGLTVFMAVVSVLFILLSLAFLARAQLADWQALGGEPWLPLGQPWQLWVNTALLALASLALHMARGPARRGNVVATRRALALGTAAGLGFLGGQLWVWHTLAAAGHVLAANPANSFFYLLTALHGLHLAGGLVALARTAAPSLHGRVDARAARNVALCSRYWHFLLVLWLVLFALVTSPQERLAGLAALCGLG